MKIPVLFALSLALLAGYAEAKSVLAHFMVGNTAHYNQALWEDEMRLAAGSGIDAFALNIANGEEHNYVQLDLAFKAAAARNFKLLFSFDYAGGTSPWTKESVLDLLRTYAGRGTYVQHKGLPLVSTFEGPDYADDWNWIKASLKVFFVPDWSSKGAKIAVGLGNGVADGLFNWAAWPDQPNWPKDTYIDASYAVALAGKPYMMPVSPWFYTNMPGFDKNWMWRGEMLWYDRWVQTLHVQPEWVQIISWNDYGESHYIAPIRGEESLVAFGPNFGKSPFNYVRGIEHNDWRIFLPHMISLYKTGTAAVTQEGLNIWYRMHPKSAGCKDSGTTAYTATHMQVERPWPEGNRDGVFFAAMLGSSASAHVTIGGTVFNPSWRYFPEGGVGIYVGFVETQATGTVKVEIKRGANVVVSLTGQRPIGGCQDGYFNFNPVVYATMGSPIPSKSPPVVINKDTPCVAGNGIGDFQDLCQNACKFNYCPLEACMCTKWGKQQGTDIVRGPPGYPAAGRDTNFEGLCAVTCSYGSAGICPSGKCGMVKLPPIVSSVSPFTAKSCTSGHALPTVPGDQAARDKICAFGCKHGYCPTDICVCDSVGVLLLPQNVGVQYTGEKPGFKSSLVGIRLLCKYTCGWGVCPAPVCKFPGSSEVALPDDGCRKGTGPGNLQGLCDFSCYLGYCPSACTCLSREGPANPRPLRTARHGFAIVGMGMEYTGLCNFTVMHNYVAPAACTNDFSKASDLYTAMPGDVGLPPSDRKRSEGNDYAPALLVERQIGTQPDDLEGLDPYWQMTEEYINKRFCGKDCTQCGANGNFDFMCLGINTDENKDASKNYCALKNGVKSGYDKWQEMEGQVTGRYIIRTYMYANGGNKGDVIDEKLRLKGTYKDNFPQTITAMWGGRDKLKGFHVHGSEWNCGSITSKQNCGLKWSDVDCTLTVVPGFVAFAVQLQYINAYFNDMYDSLTIVDGRVRARASDLMDTFKDSPADILAILTAVAGALGVLGVVGLAGGMIATLASAAGTIGGAIGGAAGAYQALNPDDPNGSIGGELESANDLEQQINILTEHLQTNIKTMMTGIFSGNDPGAFALEELVKNGQFTSQGPDKNDFIQPFEEAFVARLIPEIWKTGHRASPALILIPGLNTDFPAAHRFAGGNINDYRSNFWVTYPDGTTSDEFTVYLIDVSTCAVPSGDCIDRYRPLPGYSDLKKVGGVEPIDLMYSAFDNWRHNITGTPFISSFYFLNAVDTKLKGSRIPGAFPIPTCEWELVQKNYARFDGSNKKKCDHYPCCLDGEEGE